MIWCLDPDRRSRRFERWSEGSDELLSVPGVLTVHYIQNAQSALANPSYGRAPSQKMVLCA
jgi:hypothetical protein